MKSEKNMDCHRWHWYLLNTCKMLKYGQVLKKNRKKPTGLPVMMFIKVIKNKGMFLSKNSSETKTHLQSNKLSKQMTRSNI